MNQLDHLIKNYEKNLSWIKENRSVEFVRGYLKAIKDAKWLRDKIDTQIEKEIEDYFKNPPNKDSWEYKKIEYRRNTDE